MELSLTQEQVASSLSDRELEVLRLIASGAPNKKITSDLVIAIIPDQAALHGLLAKIRDLNITLISVNWVESKKEQP